MDVQDITLRMLHTQVSVAGQKYLNIAKLYEKVTNTKYIYKNKGWIDGIKTY